MSEPDDRKHDAERDDMGCLAAIEVFYSYLDGELDDPKTVADFERHMEHCRSCFSRAEMEGLLNERLRELARRRAPNRLRDRVRNLMRQF